MINVKLYNQQGQEIGKTDLPLEIFGVKVNPDLVHQVVTAQLANRRQPIAHTKNRGEVRGGGRKPWRQKGTGRARHGSIRSPLWRGGGVTFGPRNERRFEQKINKKIKRKAILMSLSDKVKDNKVIMLDKLEIKEGKTKEMKEILDSLSTLVKGLESRDSAEITKKKVKKLKSVLLVLPTKDLSIMKSAKNIPKIGTILAQNLNLLDILKYKYLIVPKESIEVIEKTYK